MNTLLKNMFLMLTFCGALYQSEALAMKRKFEGEEELSSNKKIKEEEVVLENKETISKEQADILGEKLVMACKNNNFEEAKKLIESGANIYYSLDVNDERIKADDILFGETLTVSSMDLVIVNLYKYSGYVVPLEGYVRCIDIVKLLLNAKFQLNEKNFNEIVCNDLRDLESAISFCCNSFLAGFLTCLIGNHVTISGED